MKLLIEKFTPPSYERDGVAYYKDDFDNIVEIKLLKELYGKNIFLAGLPLKEVPSDFHAYGLNVDRTLITELPDGLHIEETLSADNTALTTLPEYLIVHKDLYASFTNISSLPNNLCVGGDLYIMNTPISKKYSMSEVRKMVPRVMGNIYIESLEERVLGGEFM